jgi:Fic family protein
MVKYLFPDNWIKYRQTPALLDNLTKASAAVLSLKNIPYQRSWVDQLQIVQLKREVAGTSKIEGAEFTDKELDAAMSETPEQLHTRSQRQAASATKAYRWIQGLPLDRPIDSSLVFEIHRLIITNADDDHCEPGVLRGKDVHVSFGNPLHRGAEGGEECEKAFNGLCAAMKNEFQAHNVLIQALACHYHFAAMHPFCDGNGRTARALEAAILRRVGLKDTLFIAMSNYYYEEKNKYLRSLASVRAASHDLTDFLVFGLKGIELQCNKLFEEIKKNVSKAIFKNTALDLYQRLRSPRKSVIAKRHWVLLTLLIEKEKYEFDKMYNETFATYKDLKNPMEAFIRDLNYLVELGAIWVEKIEEGRNFRIHIVLEWPTRITESDFYKIAKNMPKRKTLIFR